jgi:hypothetical protein
MMYQLKKEDVGTLDVKKVTKRINMSLCIESYALPVVVEEKKDHYEFKFQDKLDARGHGELGKIVNNCRDRTPNPLDEPNPLDKIEMKIRKWSNSPWRTSFFTEFIMATQTFTNLIREQQKEIDSLKKRLEIAEAKSQFALETMAKEPWKWG